MRKCRICRGEEFKEVIDFGETPLVNSLLDKEECGTEKVYPLVVEQCQKCFLVQIVEPISTHDIYQAQDYLYFTGDMPTTSEYFGEFADELKQYVKPGELVVEIGSNDGTMLEHFSNTLAINFTADDVEQTRQVSKYRVLGVDPSTNVVIRALKTVPTLSAEFTEHNARNIAKEWGKAKILGGANCIAHLNDLHDMMRGVKELLADDGVFWVECNYWGGMVKNKNYALIYHDHFSYFSLMNWMNLLKEYGLFVFDAVVTPAQGGSLRIFVDRGQRPQTERFNQLWNEEVDTNLNSYETAKKYGKDVKEEAVNLFFTIQDLVNKGKTIAGYGAAAKGFSVLHLAGIGNEHIQYFIDDSPAKQGKYTPVTHIPVVSRKDATPVDYFFITAPNYKDVIIEKEKDFVEEGGRFITVEGQII